MTSTCCMAQQVLLEKSLQVFSSHISLFTFGKAGNCLRRALTWIDDFQKVASSCPEGNRNVYQPDNTRRARKQDQGAYSHLVWVCQKFVHLAWDRTWGIYSSHLYTPSDPWNKYFEEPCSTKYLAHQTRTGMYYFSKTQTNSHLSHSMARYLGKQTSYRPHSTQQPHRATGADAAAFRSTSYTRRAP